MFELISEGTIFGDKGRIISEEFYKNIILDDDKKYFKKVSRRKKIIISEPNITEVRFA